jgi:predicted nucleic acid-binding protein
MFLIDSSVWIEFLRPKGSPKIKAKVRDILQMEEAACCGIVMVEILRGLRTNKISNRCMMPWHRFHKLPWMTR